MSHRRGAAVTESIREAALTLAARTGRLDLSIEEIAAEAGVNKTTVYRRWDTADDLLADAVRDLAANAIPIEVTGDLRTDLRRLVDLVIATITAPLGAALLRAGRGGDSALQASRARFWDERLALAAEIVQPHRADTAPPAAALVEALVAPLHFRLVERGGSFTDDELDDLVDSIVLRTRTT